MESYDNIYKMNEKNDDFRDMMPTSEEVYGEKGLRGLGGTKMVMSYTDVVLGAYECVNDITNDNKCEFDFFK